MHKKFFILLSLVIHVHALKLDRVILATDTNLTYSLFWPSVSQAWLEVVGIRPTLAFIAPPGENIDESLGDVIRFEPIAGIPTSLQAQVIRLLLPALYPDDVCIISDIDMIPLSKSYFFDSIQHCPENSFVVYRDKAYSKRGLRYPMCYLAARGSVFAEIFSVHTVEDIRNRIRDFYACGYGWHTDEMMLFRYLHAWKNFDSLCILLGHTVERRVDRRHWTHDKNLLLSGYYIDAHCPRPYNAFKKDIDVLLTTLLCTSH